LPKRAIVAISTTALALALLFSFKTPDDRASTTQVTTKGPVGVVAGASAAPTRTATQAPAATQAPVATDAPAATAAPAAGDAYKNGSVTGPVVNTRFGPVQVEVTISGGKVADVTAVQLPFDHPRSQEISDYAAPILQSEAVQAQSAQIDLVSGATYTSIAYARSLQAALDQTHG
jgi:uncharacterized protein with FMN-binding domain